jgi:hypothetical protein
MLGSTFNSHLKSVSFSRCARRLCLGMLLSPLAFGPINLARAQTTYSPTTVTVTCTPELINGCSISNPAGPETQSGGSTTLISSPPAPPNRVLWPTCEWKGFPSVILQAPATLSIPLKYQTSGKGTAEILIAYGTAPNQEAEAVFSSDYNGTVYFTIPAGTNLSALSVEISIAGGVGNAASGYVDWITVK